jgi:hypothetical protein
LEVRKVWCNVFADVSKKEENRKKDRPPKKIKIKKRIKH